MTSETHHQDEPARDRDGTTRVHDGSTPHEEGARRHEVRSGATEPAEVLAALRTASPPPTAYAALRRARPVDATEGTTRRRRVPAGRTLALALAGLAVAGTATAAVTASGSFDGLRDSATADAPAARNLAPLLGGLEAVLADQADRVGEVVNGDGDRVYHVPPGALRGSGRARGTTVTRDGVSVDVAFDERTICMAAAGPRESVTGSGATGRTERSIPPFESAQRLSDPPAVACIPIVAPTDTLPSISGRDGARVWLAAVVPDDVSDLRITADGDRSVTPTVERNVAVASFPGADHVSGISWTAADGSRVDHDLGTRRQKEAPVIRRPGL